MIFVVFTFLIVADCARAGFVCWCCCCCFFYSYLPSVSALSIFSAISGQYRFFHQAYRFQRMALIYLSIKPAIHTSFESVCVRACRTKTQKRTFIFYLLRLRDNERYLCTLCLGAFYISLSLSPNPSVCLYSNRNKLFVIRRGFSSTADNRKRRKWISHIRPDDT